MAGKESEMKRRSGSRQIRSSGAHNAAMRKLNRRAVRRQVFFVIAMVTVLVSPGLGHVAAAAGKRDILLIMVDDLRPMLGCYGHQEILTPNIDRLAQRGVLYERAYCQYAKCGTSRLSLMTGLRPDSIGVFSNSDRDVVRFREQRPGAATMARWFRQHGYFTQSFGKIDHDGWHVDDDWSVPASPGRPGEMLEIVDGGDVSKPTVIADRLSCPVIQSPDVEDDFLFAGRMTQQVLSKLREGDSNQPMFLAVGYRRPHLPFVAPKRYFEKYQPDESWLAKNPRPAVDSPVMAWFNSDAYVGMARRTGLQMPDRPDRTQAMEWNGYEMRSYLGVPNQGTIDVPLQLQLLQAYAACVSYVDAQIGKLLDEVESSERRDSTLIILCSDHGWHLGEHSAWGKMTNFEIATRVPLMISGPGIKAGRTRSLAELVDLYPTICDLSGVARPNHLEGESLVPSLKDPRSSENSIALSQYSRFGGRFTGRALRTDRYRYIVWEARKSGEVVHRELYDHDVDPMETENIAGKSVHQQLVVDLESRLGEAFRNTVGQFR